MRFSDQERPLDLRDEVRVLASEVIYAFSLGLNGKNLGFGYIFNLRNNANALLYP